MIFTDRFVYVHEPKTGGSFVTEALLRLYGLEWSKRLRLEAMLRGHATRNGGPYGSFTYHNLKHGTYSQVPPPHREKLVLATVRGPYEMYVSQYEFGWWRRREVRRHFAAVPAFGRRFPRFPDLSFPEFVELWDAAMGDPEEEGRGAWTRQFIRFYFREPERVRAWPDDVLRDPEARRAAMPRIHFVPTDRLREGLHAFLLDRGYRPGDVQFVLEMGKVLPGKGRSDEQRWERYYTPELKARVRRRERLLLEIIPEFDV
ncbi:MAG TPA: hypothetical protein VFX98_11200 [Longimicrobiaceae bacterium]|nr:hypothetical protein [Longimicrobiaceae bacterium]